MKNITYDIHSFKWDIDSNTFYGDAWNLQEVGNGSYYQFPFPNGKKEFYIKNFGTWGFRRFRFVREVKMDYTNQWLFESEDGIKCMVNINKNIMKTIAQQINWDFEANGSLEIKDTRGYYIYSENSTGWSKLEYDSQGNQTYWENSYGNWVKREYDFKGNQIYYEDSDGYWDRSQYDSQGNEIYFENSKGQIIDDRPKSCEDKVVEIDGVKYKLVKQ